MSIAVQCGHCNSRFSAPESANGKTVPCPKCGQSISIHAPIDFEPPLVSVSSRSEPTTNRVPLLHSLAESLRRLPWKRTLIVVSVLAFLVTLRNDSGLGTLIHYASLFFILWTVAAKIAARFRNPAPWYLLVPPIVALVWLWGYFDYNISHWTDTTDSGAKWYYTDYTYRGKYRPYYRRAWTSGTGKDQIVHLSIEGGFSETGKQHGYWHTSTLYTVEHADATGESFSNDDRWYWYGEEITEGEWHLRDR